MKNRPPMTSAACGLAVSLSLGLLGCALPEVDHSTGAIEGSNALSENRLSYNRLSYNRLSYNRLSYNALSENRLSYNSLDNDMHETDEGLDLLRYIARCALAEGDSLVVDVDGAEVDFPGSLGLAEDWLDEALDEDGQRRISGCLIAHVNAFGVAVPISLRFVPDVQRSQEERETFSRYEGAFFGNLFSEDIGALYSCYGDAPPTHYDESAGDAMLRLCSGESCGPIENLGSCESICRGRGESGNFTKCTVPGADQSEYKRPIHVWLLEADNNNAAWTDHVDMLSEHWGAAPPKPGSTGGQTNQSPIDPTPKPDKPKKNRDLNVATDIAGTASFQ